MSCFQGLFFCPEAASLLLHNFCIYHISPPGHEVCTSVSVCANIVPDCPYEQLIHTILFVISLCTYSWEVVQFLQMFQSRLLMNSQSRLQMFLITLGNIFAFFGLLFNLYAVSFLLLESRMQTMCVRILGFNISLLTYSICRLGSVMCMGVTAGAYILTLFAVSFCK